MNWNTIPDAFVRHVWEAEEDANDQAIVEPSWYADNGTPITEDAGDDMCYVRTEIQQPATFDDLMRLLLVLCPGGSMGEDNDGQLVFYTDLRSKDGQAVEAFEPEPSEPQAQNPGVST